jgi:hypothetical protein
MSADHIQSIKSRGTLTQLWVLTVCLLGCHSTPDEVVIIKSPSDSIFYSKETWRGHGPVSNDFTRIYAHYRSAKQTDRQLVLDGEYIQNTRITWTSDIDVDLCVTEGLTNTFRNEVTLNTGEITSIAIRNHLKEHC